MKDHSEAMITFANKVYYARRKSDGRYFIKNRHEDYNEQLSFYFNEENIIHPCVIVETLYGMCVVILYDYEFIEGEKT